MTASGRWARRFRSYITEWAPGLGERKVETQEQQHEVSVHLMLARLPEAGFCGKRLFARASVNGKPVRCALLSSRLAPGVELGRGAFGSPCADSERARAVAYSACSLTSTGWLKRRPVGAMQPASSHTDAHAPRLVMPHALPGWSHTRAAEWALSLAADSSHA